MALKSEIMNFRLFILFVILLNSCSNNPSIKKETKEFNGDIFYKDSYKAINHYGDSLDIYEAYIRESNDTVYMMDDIFDECNEVWKIGLKRISNHNLFSVGNECNLSTIIYHLESKTSKIDTFDNEIIYKFNITSGMNDLDSDEESIIYYSKKRGIISYINLEGSNYLHPLY